MPSDKFYSSQLNYHNFWLVFIDLQAEYETAAIKTEYERFNIERSLMVADSLTDKIMSLTLNRELETIEADIKQSIIDGDNFAYSKHLRRRQETQDKLYFAETKAMREELENLESSRSFGLSMKREIQLELTAASEIVADITKRLISAQRAWEEVKLRAYFNDTQTEQERKDIQELKKRLTEHINSKLGETKDDFIN